MVGFDGTVSIVTAVEVDLKLERRTFRGRYLVTSSETGILGRDILRHLVLLLDGPRGQWSEAAR